MGSILLIVVIVAGEILGVHLTLAGTPLNQSFEFDVLDPGAVRHRVFASSVRGSKQRCAANCAQEPACTQFCFKTTTKQCLLEDAVVRAATSADEGEAGDLTCYLRSIPSACVKSFTGQTYIDHIFPFPAFDGEFVLDFAVQIAADAMVSLSVDRTHAGIKYEVVMGKNENTQTVIRRNWSEGDLVSIAAGPDGVVSGDEMRRFWLRYDHGSFTLGEHGNTAFLEWTDPTPPANPPSYIGLGGWVHIGHWIIYTCF